MITIGGLGGGPIVTRGYGWPTSVIGAFKTINLQSCITTLVNLQSCVTKEVFLESFICKT